MNTVTKGDEFEDKCYELITDAIKNGFLGAIPSQCRIFKKQPYYSHRRGNIIFDLSIEVWPPNADRPVLLYLIECKNLGSAVPVDDVEEFEKKIEQVAGLNVKGVVIAKNSFQSGAFKFAKSGNIMLIEAKEDGSYSILLHRTTRQKNLKGTETLQQSESANSISDTNSDELELLEKTIDALLQGLFENQENSSEKAKINLKRLSKSEIEEIAQELIKCINPSIIKHHTRTPLPQLEGFLRDEFGLTIDVSNLLSADSKGRKIFGYCDLQNRLIRIDHSIVETGRFAFLLAHEIGHFILHSNLRIDQKYYDTLEDSEFNYQYGRHEQLNERQWIEWQANRFAESLLMPRESIKAKMIRFQLERGLGINRSHYMFYDSQFQNIQDFKTIIARLADFFGVNKTNVIYRLEGLDLIKRGNEVLTVGQIISRI